MNARQFKKAADLIEIKARWLSDPFPAFLAFLYTSCQWFKLVTAFEAAVEVP